MAGFEVKCSCGKTMKRLSFDAKEGYLTKETLECPRCHAKVIIDHDIKKPKIELKAPMRVMKKY